MKLYELTYLISSDLSAEEIKSFPEKINSLIREEGGILSTTLSLVKIPLAYPMEKKTSAFLSTLSFQLSQEKLAGLEKRLKSEGQILRYFILAKPVPKIITGSPPSRVRVRKIVRKPKPKVELKEIEKKLEEILGENEPK